jgi:hypothetical protein
MSPVRPASAIVTVPLSRRPPSWAVRCSSDVDTLRRSSGKSLTTLFAVRLTSASATPPLPSSMNPDPDRLPPFSVPPSEVSVRRRPSRVMAVRSASTASVGSSTRIDALAISTVPLTSGSAMVPPAVTAMSAAPPAETPSASAASAPMSICPCNVPSSRPPSRQATVPSACKRPAVPCSVAASRRAVPSSSTSRVGAVCASVRRSNDSASVSTTTVPCTSSMSALGNASSTPRPTVPLRAGGTPGSPASGSASTRAVRVPGPASRATKVGRPGTSPSGSAPVALRRPSPTAALNVSSVAVPPVTVACRSTAVRPVGASPA